ncbi:MAG: DUF1902 domain-containing protein [Tissierellia bacterium]|nr:DUF1902 domain-containing protein [Tissierellia bacterium]
MIRIKIVWDKEADVWIATSDDIKGLVLESSSLDALIERVKYAVPELIELSSKSNYTDISLDFKIERQDRIIA